MRLLLCVVVALMALSACQAQNFGNELGNIDFVSILGGPLEAVVKAQAQAAIVSASFIDELGFEGGDENKRVVTVDFLYDVYDAGTNTTTTSRMELPFLLMVPIPYIEMESMFVDFQVQLSSVQEDVSTTSSQFGYTHSSRGGGWFSRSKWSSSFSSQSSTRTTGKVKKDYKLHVRVDASQSPIPRGMDRVLDLFEQLVQQNLPLRDGQA